MSQALVASHAGHDGMALVDVHTPVHFGTGLVAGIVGVDAYTAMMAFVGAKIIAETIRGSMRKAVFSRDHSESLGNELVDLAFEMIGHHLGHYLREQHFARQAAAAAVEQQQAEQETVSGLAAYYSSPSYVPISGLGAYYVDPVNVPIR